MHLLLASAALAEPDVQVPPEYLLAAQVATTCGNPYALAEVGFTFVVEVEGVEQVRRTHHWKPQEGSVTVTSGERTVELEQLAPYIASTADSDEALTAYKQFVNDSYWLLFPCKVLDPGVELGLDEGRLTLAFADGTGVTSGDRYTLTVDEAGHVTTWSFVLESGREGAFTFDPPTRYGPLTLSTRATSDDVVIRFDEVFAR